MRVIAELGSTHLGLTSRILEALSVCKEYDMDLKLQLFPNIPKYTDSGNIYLPPEIYDQTVARGRELGVNVGTSVFDRESFGHVFHYLEHKPHFIKFAYSQKHQREWIKDTLDAGIEAIVSCDVLTEHQVDPRATKLYCIPQYPVPFVPTFDELFPRFQGFSDHTLGLRHTMRAVVAGAKIIEKHVRLGYDDELNCPDGTFAVNINDLGQLTQDLKRAALAK